MECKFQGRSKLSKSNQANLNSGAVNRVVESGIQAIFRYVCMCMQVLCTIKKKVIIIILLTVGLLWLELL